MHTDLPNTVDVLFGVGVVTCSGFLSCVGGDLPGAGCSCDCCRCTATGDLLISVSSFTTSGTQALELLYESCLLRGVGDKVGLLFSAALAS
jgi:hypothetical protein